VELRTPQQRLLFVAAAIGLAVLAVGVTLGVTTTNNQLVVTGVLLEAMGGSVLFPILVSFAYDRLRERWLGDEVWRLFTELSDAGICRVYKDREATLNHDNAQSRLRAEFLSTEAGDIYIMGPTLKAFFHRLGPFNHDIETMLRNASGRVKIHALIERADSQAVKDRTEIEEPSLAPGDKAQTERDAESSVATVRSMVRTLGPHIELRRFMQAPYCTAIVFPEVAFYSPNLLAPEVPVRLPMILFRVGSHGYNMLRASFNYLWEHPHTIAVTVPHQSTGGRDEHLSGVGD
jgi:hypothetical protein